MLVIGFGAEWHRFLAQTLIPSPLPRTGVTHSQEIRLCHSLGLQPLEMARLMQERGSGTEKEACALGHPAVCGLGFGRHSQSSRRILEPC